MHTGQQSSSEYFNRFKLLFFGLKDYWWPGGLSSFTRIGGRARAQPGGLRVVNRRPSASEGDQTAQEQLLRESIYILPDRHHDPLRSGEKLSGLMYGLTNSCIQGVSQRAHSSRKR